MIYLGIANQKRPTTRRIAAKWGVNRWGKRHTLDSSVDKVNDMEAERETDFVPGLISFSFDATVMISNETKSDFFGKGNVGADSTLDPISEPNTFSTKVKDSSLALPAGNYVTVFDNALEEVVKKDKVRVKKKIRKCVLSKSLGRLDGPVFPSLAKKLRPKKSNTAFQAQLTNGVGHNSIGPLSSLATGGVSIYGTDPSQWENDIHHFHGEHYNESNIIRCNNRLKSNFCLFSENKMVEAITKLGVCYGIPRKG